MRRPLPNRRNSVSFNFEHESIAYHASASRFPDGQLAEIFLTTGKPHSAAQVNAETSAILVSLLLQHGVSAAEILHSIGGPIAVALNLAEAPE